MKSLEKDIYRLKKSVSAIQKFKEDDDNDLSISSAKGLSHFQKGIMTLEESYPKIALALKLSKSLDLDLRYVLLLDNQLMFNMCCNDVQNQEGKSCFEHDKKWRWFQDHQARQIPRVQILGLV
jgi:hypothetical protein